MFFRRLLFRASVPFFHRHYKKFIAGIGNAQKVQRQVLFEKLRRNADSDFGRDHSFSNIKTVADFRKQVPIRDYEYYREYVERVKKGELTAMFSPETTVHMFAMTSGTTNKSKYIPITNHFLDEYRRSWLTWGGKAAHDHDGIVWTKVLQLLSNWDQERTEAGIPCGNISGLVAALGPKVVRLKVASPISVVSIENPSAKHYAGLRFSLTHPDVGLITTANPSTLLEFARRADRWSESLIRDIRDGTLTPEDPIPQKILDELHPYSKRKDPKRARELESLIEQHGALYPKHAWPHLHMLAVWLGGSVGVYLPLLKEFYGDTVQRDHGLSASEGRMTIPTQDETAAGILDYQGHYYEFVPQEEMESENPTVLEASELEEGKDYYILLSTSSGLYRYDIRDVVRCVGFEGTCPILTFLNKGAHFSSFTGEKLSEYQAVTAAKKSYEELNLSVETFSIAPVLEENKPGYVLLIEPSEGRDNDKLAQRVEQHLQNLNHEYQDKLESGRLIPLAVQEIPKGTWLAYRKARTSARGNFEEFKHPCLVGDLEFVPKIMSFLANDAKH